jgi:long-subunit acyl-CoA synthetase (AMP-forming)
MLRTIWGDNERYIKTYWEKFQNRYYVAGDSAHRDADGYFWIMGRIDDVLNVAGHRLGTMEIESALVAHPRVAEAAVVGRQHEIKGESVFAFVVCKGARPEGDTHALIAELRATVTEQLGAIAKPDDIRFADNLPKTRSGKIMRRLLRAIARCEPITQDISTLENPAIIDQLRGVDSAVTPAAAPAPRARRKPAAKAKTKSAAKAKAKSKVRAKSRVKPRARVRTRVRPAAPPRSKAKVSRGRQIAAKRVAAKRAVAKRVAKKRAVASASRRARRKPGSRR